MALHCLGYSWARLVITSVITSMEGRQRPHSLRLALQGPCTFVAGSGHRSLDLAAAYRLIGCPRPCFS